MLWSLLDWGSPPGLCFSRQTRSKGTRSHRQPWRGKMIGARGNHLARSPLRGSTITRVRGAFTLSTKLLVFAYVRVTGGQGPRS